MEVIHSDRSIHDYSSYDKISRFTPIEIEGEYRHRAFAQKGDKVMIITDYFKKINIASYSEIIESSVKTLNTDRSYGLSEINPSIIKVKNILSNNYGFLCLDAKWVIEGKKNISMYQLRNSFIIVEHNDEGKHLYDMQGGKMLDYPVENFNLINIAELDTSDCMKFSEAIQAFYDVYEAIEDDNFETLCFVKNNKRGLLIFNPEERSKEVVLQPEFEDILIYPYPCLHFVAKRHKSKSWKAINLFGEEQSIPCPLTTPYKELVSKIDPEFEEYYLGIEA